MATVLSRALLTPWSCAAQIWSRAIGCSVAASATRDHCLGFRATVSPLPVVPSFACSVASLSRFPGLERPGCQGLRPENLAGHWLGVDGARCPQELVWWFPLQSHNPSDDRRSPVTILLVARPWTCHPSFRRPAPLRPSVPLVSSQNLSCLCAMKGAAGGFEPATTIRRPAQAHQPGVYLEPKWLR